MKVMFLGLFLCMTSFLEAKTIAGKVIAVEGSVDAGGRALVRSSVVYVGDTIDVKEGGKIQIRFTDGTLINLAEVTTFVIEDYLFQHKRETDHMTTELVVGGCRVLTGEIAKSRPKDFAIKTPVATIGVLGTYLVISFRAGKLEVACLEGNAYVSNEKGIVSIGPGRPTKYATVQTITTGTTTGETGGQQGVTTTTGGVATAAAPTTTTPGAAASGVGVGAGAGVGGLETEAPAPTPEEGVAPQAPGGESAAAPAGGTEGAEAEGAGGGEVGAPMASAEPPPEIEEVVGDTQISGALPLQESESAPGKIFIEGGC